MGNSNIIIKNYNGTGYDELYPKTLSEQVVESSLKKFVSDAEKLIWNSHNNYVHPSTHSPSIIAQDSLNRFVTDAEKSNWNSKPSQATTYTKTEVDTLISSLVSNLDWKEAVATFSDLATTYPNAEEGWTTSVKDVDKIYRYNGTTWIDILNGISMALATSGMDGLMSKGDFTKLTGISTNATKTENSSTNGNIKINGVEQNVYSHPTGTNPHSTTKSDVGLSNVDNTSDINKPISTLQANALNLKVDKISGKGLSTNDFSTVYKNKVDGLNRTVTNTTQPTGSAVGDIWFQII